MYAGRLVECAPVLQLFDAPAHPYTRALLAAVPRLRGPQSARLESIAGQPPRPGEVTMGCAFAPRCPQADAHCMTVRPELEVAGDTSRTVACHRPLRAIVGCCRRMSTPSLLEVQRSRRALPSRAASGWRQPAGALDALDDVSLRLPAGGRLGIVGESGSGKSTLARVVLGFVRAPSGLVLWDGAPVDYDDARQLRALRRQLQVVFQDPFSSLDPRMTAGESVAEALQATSTVRRTEGCA